MDDYQYRTCISIGTAILGVMGALQLLRLVKIVPYMSQFLASQIVFLGIAFNFSEFISFPIIAIGMTVIVLVMTSNRPVADTMKPTMPDAKPQEPASSSGGFTPAHLQPDFQVIVPNQLTEPTPRKSRAKISSTLEPAPTVETFETVTLTPNEKLKWVRIKEIFEQQPNQEIQFSILQKMLNTNPNGLKHFLEKMAALNHVTVSMRKSGLQGGRPARWYRLVKPEQVTVLGEDVEQGI